MKQSADTKERLLDAAEEVYAREGYRAASLRTITAAAAVNLAAVSYHFGSKRGLLEAVFGRRLEAMNLARVHGLALVRDRARSAGRPPKTRELIETFVGATLDHAGTGPGERHFMALLLRSFSDSDRTVRHAFEGFMRPTFEALRAALAEALPTLPPDELWWRLQFALGAMIRLHHLALAAGSGDGQPGRPAGAETTRLLVDFMSAGLVAPRAAPARHTASPQGAST